MISFQRPEEGLRFLYELATSDDNRDLLSTASTDNQFFSTLDEALTDNPLPPLAVITKYFAPGGSLLTNDETGFHYMGFAMRRTDEE